MKTSKVFIILFMSISINTVILSQENNPRIGFLPFTTSYAAGSELASQVETVLARYMSEHQIFIPYSVKNWLERDFVTHKAGNIEELLSAAIDIKLPVDYLCQGNVFKCGRHYGVLISLYPLETGNYYSYYLRYFTIASSFFIQKERSRQLNNLAKSITAEMQARHKRRVSMESMFYYKTIYLERFKLHFMDKPGESGNAGEVSSLEIDDVIYKETDSFFNQVFLYNFHISKFFTLRNNNPDNYLEDPQVIPGEVDYIVAAELFAAADSSLLKIILEDYKGKKTLLEYEYPFAELNYINLNNALRENVLIIASFVLNAEELNHTGIAKIVTDNQPVFYEDYYLGEGSQANLLLAFGYNHFTIGNKKRDIFVKPFFLNSGPEKK